MRLSIRHITTCRSFRPVGSDPHGLMLKPRSDVDLDPCNAGAAHAWAEVCVPGPGWIAFDPSNGCLGAAGPIKVAAGRASARALPIVGSCRGEAGDYLGLEGQVTAAECAMERTDLATFRAMGSATC